MSSISKTAERFIAEYGGPEDYKFAAAIQLKTATALDTVFGNVTRYEPWNNVAAKGLLDHHPVAIWRELAVRLEPRGGIYGRMCTFYGGWAASGVATPTTVSEMIGLNNSISITYGGTGDPGTIKADIKCPFDMTMKDLLKAPDNEAARPVFFYCFTELDVVKDKADADRFMLTFRGRYTLHGRY